MNINHTYSIVAISEDRSELGIAVQSHWFSVGSVCPWIIPGVGAIATQSMVEISYGPNGLTLLKQGKSAKQALKYLLAKDDKRDLRQVSILDAQGGIATHTGKKCILEAGHSIGENYSVQANMMLHDTVWGQMAESFESTKGRLADRLYAALLAAQNTGGDIRGQQSAAIIVVDNIDDDEPWEHFTTNLRVDDHCNPIEELDRLLKIEKAYALMNEGDVLITNGDVSGARKKYATAASFAPDIEELPFWEAVTLADIGEIEQALPIFKRVFEINPHWSILVQRLPASGLLTDDPHMMRKIMSTLKERKT